MSRSASSVSIATVNWNGRQHLAVLLPSLQELSPGEIIVVDNGSTDGSVEFLQSQFPDVHVLVNPVNRGFAQPCNLAARHARGESLAFINNDMRADPGWLKTALPLLDDQARCIASRIVNWDGSRIDFNGSSLQYLGYALQRDIGELVDQVTHDEWVLFPCGGAMIIDRDYFLRIGGFDEDFFAVFEDVDLGWRIWLTGKRVRFVPESVVFHRGHATFRMHESEKLRYLMHRNALQAIVKNYEDETLRKVLPAAILLAIKRAVLFSGVEKEQFYLWATTRERIQWGDRAFQDRVLDSLNHLVAVDDVLENLAHLLDKRRQVQKLRKLGDDAIIALFGDPLRTIVDDPGYLLQEKTLLEWLGLSDLLGSPPPEPFSSWPDELTVKVRRLRQELRAREWLNTRSSQMVPGPSAPGVRQFFKTWQTSGFRTAWSHFLDFVNRGL